MRLRYVINTFELTLSVPELYIYQYFVLFAFCLTQSFIRGCLAYRKEDRMDVFALSRHEYLQPPVPKHGRQTQLLGCGSGSNSSSTNAGGSNVNNQQSGSSQQNQPASFSTGLFGNMNQSSSS